MPFDDDDSDVPSLQSQKVGLKNVSSQKSMFDTIPKKPNQHDLDTKVKVIQEKSSGYQAKAAELTLQFNKLMADKTLPQNKNLFQKSLETELLKEMVSLSQEISSSPNEKEGDGSLIWIILLLKNALAQRDKINLLEYQISQLNTISKEIQKTLDNNKKDE